MKNQYKSRENRDSQLNLHIFNELLINEKELLIQLVERLKNKVKFLEGSSYPIFLIDMNRLVNEEKIALWLITKFILKKIGAVENEDMSIDELEEKCRLSRKIIIARLKDLRDKKIIERTKGINFRINLPAAIFILDKIDKRLEKEIN